MQTKVRNLSAKHGSGFHIQGQPEARGATEEWIMTYHAQSFSPHTQEVPCDDGLIHFTN